MWETLIQWWDGIPLFWELVIRLLLAGVFGGAVGIERSLRQKDAGFRTHVIVSIGAALVMIVSQYGFQEVVAEAGGLDISADVTRVASNIITGIGFLGAGVIFVKGASIKGLTTAAGIWATAAVGMAIGAGMYLLGIFASLIIIGTQVIFHIFLIGNDRSLANESTMEMVARIDNTPEALASLKHLLAQREVHIVQSQVSLQDDHMVVVLTVSAKRALTVDETAQMLSTGTGIRFIGM